MIRSSRSASTGFRTRIICVIPSVPSASEPASAADGAPRPSSSAITVAQDEWLWGWDPTPGIVSVWAEPDGRAIVWRRIVETGELVREDERFRPWLLLDGLDDLRHLSSGLAPEETSHACVRAVAGERNEQGSARWP